MRKIILNLAVSLDGFIEGPDGAIDWCFTDQDYGMAAFLDRTDAILMGRKSYELLLTMGADAFPGHKKYVFSRTLSAVESPYLLVTEPAEAFVRRLQAGPGKDIWLFGGAAFITTVMNARLVNELMLSVHPVLLGSGMSLLSGLAERASLRLERTEAFSTGLVQLFYAM